MVQLGGYVDLVMGQAPPGETCNKEGVGTVFVKAGEFQERSPAIREWTCKPLKFAKTNDTLVCVVGATAGKVNFAAFDCAIGRSVSAVRPIPDKIDPLFLFHFLQTTVGLLRDRAQGAAQGVITREMLQSLSLVLPPLPEQRRIAAILDQADALRAKRREALAELDQLTQSIFIEMFGDPDTNPKQWPTSPLGKQASVVGGYAFKSGDYVASGIPLMRIGDVNRGGFKNETACFLPEEFSEEYSRFLVFPGDLLMSLTGTTGKDDYGNIAVLGPERENYLLNQRVACIRPRSSLVTREYLENFLGNKKIKERIISRSRGVRQANISNPDILELSLPLPPVETQHKFAKSVDSVRNLKSNNLAAAVQSERLFTSLQHRAFRGEL